jgi:hypothetical protein
VTEKKLGLGTPSVPVISALRRVLRPLIRFLMTQGITYPYLSELLKSVYVDVANNDFPLEGKRQTDSRISLLTGVHRKDVKRLGSQRRGSLLPPPSVSLGAQLVAKWVSDPDYLDANGHPIPLKRLAGDGRAKSFEGLVASISKDIRSRAILDEWLRLGVARIDPNDCICLMVEAFVPERGFDEKAFYLGQNVGDHLSAAVSNVVGGSKPYLERSVYYDELSAESVLELNQMSAELGMLALQKINRRAIDLEARDAKEKKHADQRMNFGIYFYHTRREEAFSSYRRSDDSPADETPSEGRDRKERNARNDEEE